MSGGGNPGASGGGTGGDTKPSWQGGGTPDTFDPKTFGTTLFSDLSRIYQQGPKVNPIANYTPYSGATNHFIQEGIGNDASLRDGLIGDIAGGKSIGNDYLHGPVADLTRHGGLDPTQRGVQTELGGIDRGYGQLGDNNGLTGQQGRDLGSLHGLQGGYAGLSGAYDQNAPGYARMRQKALDDAVKNVGGGFNASGRFGGGSYIGDATNAAVDAVAPLDYQNYQNSVNNKYRSLDSQQGLLGNTFGMEQQGVGNQFGALAGRAGIAQSRFGNAQTGIGNEIGASGLQDQASQRNLQNLITSRGLLDNSTAQGLGYSGLLDSKAKERTASNQDMWDRKNNSGYNQIAKYLGLLQGNGDSTNKPTSLWDILGGIGSTVGSFL